MGTACAPAGPRQTSVYGPAAIVRSYGRVPGTGSNRHVPVCPGAGRSRADPLVTQSQPPGSTRLSVLTAVRSGWSKQQNTLGAAVG